MAREVDKGDKGDNNKTGSRCERSDNRDKQ